LDKLELYYDHYKETCYLSKEAQSMRNKNLYEKLLLYRSHCITKKEADYLVKKLCNFMYA